MLSSLGTGILMIKLLEQHTIDKIKAGEVIERPLSIIKELVENSIDARATNIKVELFAGGLAGMIVSDNGIGMSKQDLLTAIKPHATSKLTDISDLDHVSTLGFRGEGLTSICACSKVTITTNTQEDLVGYELTVRELVELKEVTKRIGTSIKVLELFYNIPARRKFLKSERTELLKIVELLEQIAMVNPQIMFTIINNGKSLKKWEQSPESDLYSRAKIIYGGKIPNQYHELSKKHRDLCLKGLIFEQESLPANFNLRLFFINNRVVRDKVVSHAINTVMQNSRMFSYILNFNIDYDQVDINVHPQKFEVRFRDPRIVSGFIAKEVQDRLISGIDSDTKFTGSTKSLHAAYFISEHFLIYIKEQYQLLSVKQLHKEFNIGEVKNSYFSCYKNYVEYLKSLDPKSLAIYLTKNLRKFTSSNKIGKVLDDEIIEEFFYE